MPDFLCDELKDYISRLYGLLPTDRIFHLTKSFLHHEMTRGAEKAGVKRIRIHDLRHPYVKHTTKKYNSEKQKTQATKMDLIAWVFRFLHLQLFKEVMDLVNNLNAIVREYIHLFNQ